ncbi:DUF1805 family protein YunC [Bacillus licheniformis WX-02]|jgi:uncharacterized protein YunC (DUF1805 family)|nr:DUF1805 family protein YunC [Bacillus licheniformis WX-02]
MSLALSYINGKGGIAMVNLTPIMIEDQPFTAVTVKLPKTNFMAVTNDHGYIMCGALDVALLNDKLKERKIVAARAVGVRTIDQLLEAPLESVTDAAGELGIHPGMSGKEALLKMVK